jgi:hypothetical protein
MALPSLSVPLVVEKRKSKVLVLALSLISAALGCVLSVFSQTPPEPVPFTWLRDGKLVAEEYNFSIDSLAPTSHWSYSRLADIEGSKATAFIVEVSTDTKFFVMVWDKSSRMDSDSTKHFVHDFVNGMQESIPKDWRIDDARSEPSAYPLKDSLKITITIHPPNEATMYTYGYVVTGNRTYMLVDFSPKTAESPQFNHFVGSFALLSPSKSKSDFGFSVFHWLIVAALLGYIWLLVKIARPRPLTKPVTDSKAWLRTQTVLSWFCTLLFGFLTFGMLALNANRQHRSESTRHPEGLAGAIGFMVGYLFSVLGLPLFFALSVRWKRSVANKKKALHTAPVAAANSIES